ncbi:hypothetical protein PM082_000408 [Marasmius tenuissimus]|nr:hypothetical protein PM082_000408 [Marasmius tenuissimus]
MAYIPVLNKSQWLPLHKVSSVVLKSDNGFRQRLFLELSGYLFHASAISLLSYDMVAWRERQWLFVSGGTPISTSRGFESFRSSELHTRMTLPILASAPLRSSPSHI